MSIYLSKLDKETKVLWLACPACSTKIDGDLDEYLSNNWVATCPKCGAVFGHVDLARFRSYVSAKWKQPGPTLKGVVDQPPTYADFLIFCVGDGLQHVRRWHGWVDPVTREVVQEG